MKIQHNAVLRRTTGFPGVAAALCLALLCAVPARAAFLDLGAGARATGMGNAFVAVDDDAYAIYYNPAGLALLEQSELATSYTKNMIGLSDGSSMSTSFVGFAQPLKAGWGTLGAAWQQFDLNGGLYSD